MPVETFKQYRRRVLRMIDDFQYPPIVREKVEKAKTEMEIEHILISARHGRFYE